MNWAELKEGTLRRAGGLACRCKGGGVIINEHTLDARQMRLHIEALSRWYDFIPLDELPIRLEHPGRRPFCLMTFDDGKESNATQVAPELLRLGVPAVFYVVTEAVGSQVPLWFDRYAALVRKLPRLPAGLEPGVVKRLPLAVLEERLNRCCAQYGVESDTACENVRLMSWEQIRVLAGRGFAIGAHGLSHAILTNEPKVAAKTEIEQSLAQVNTEVGVRNPTFAFPNGNYTPVLARHALQCGARTVMTTEPLWVNWKCPLWRLPRIQLSRNVSAARIYLKLVAAATGRILQNPDGTGKAYVDAKGES